MQSDSSVKDAIGKAGDKNEIAVKALLKDLDKAVLEQDGSIKGLSDQIKELQKSEESNFLFKDASSKLKGATPPQGSQGGTGTVTKEQFKAMGYKERVELFNTNKELYNSLQTD